MRAGRARVGLLVSGRGSNMESLVRAMCEGRVDAEPVVVVSNVPTAAGLTRARELGVPTALVDSRRIVPREEHERQVLEVLRGHGVDLVCLAGYMRLLSPAMVHAFPQRLLNIHPSLLPAFPGLEAQRQALEHGAKVTGCTVHLVDEQCDHGPIVCQAAVPILEQDSVDSLSERILAEEHRIYPQALAWLCAGRLAVEGRRVRIVSPS